jgi:hypothetical protein
MRSPWSVHAHLRAQVVALVPGPAPSTVEALGLGEKRTFARQAYAARPRCDVTGARWVCLRRIGL